VTSRSEVVVTFLALLELIRLKQLVAVQTEAFGEIVICRAPPGAEIPAQTSEPAAAPAAETSVKE
jgi:segregation and condensation protein A